MCRNDVQLFGWLVMACVVGFHNALPPIVPGHCRAHECALEQRAREGDAARLADGAVRLVSPRRAGRAPGTQAAVEQQLLLLS